MKYLKLLLNKEFYTKILPHPISLFSIIYYTIYYLYKNPNWSKIDQKVDGLISLPVAIFLHRAVLNTKEHPSSNIIEVGAYKGKSTIFLSSAAKRSGKRLKSFELFTGLPTADPVLDPAFRKGEQKSDIDEYNSNVRTYGCQDVVDSIVGDARETMLPALGGGGFCLAFLDVGVYEVTKDLLGQLLSVAGGGETIFVHDTYSPGIRKAIEESIRLSKHTIRRSEPIYYTAKLQIIET